MEKDNTRPVYIIGHKNQMCIRDRQISPAELAGKSGQVRIRFDYENTATETVTVKKKAYEIQTPFLVMSALILPSDIFSNIEVENGKLMQMDEQNMVIGYAMPGLADSLQLSGYEAVSYTHLSNTA